MKIVQLLQGLFVFCQGCASFQWASSSPPDGQVVYVCRGATVLIPWQYLLDAGDSVGDVTWLYDGHSQEIIAIMTHGQLVVLPAFAHRVQASGTAGLSLTGVQVGDSGNYTIEVQVLQGHMQDVMRRSVFLYVTDQVMTVDGSVHVTQSSEVILDPRTGQYSVLLQCGQWIFADNPPFQVEWVTPDGQVVNSSDYHDHHFTLTLPPPIKGGNYSCRIPPQHADLACLHGNAEHQGEATVTVDKVDAQLSILLKENQQLKQQIAQDNLQLTERLNHTENELSVSKTQISQTQSDLARTKAALSQIQSQTQSDLSQAKSDLAHTQSELSQLKTQMSALNATHGGSGCCEGVKGRLQKLEDAARHQVAFQARELQAHNPPNGTPLIFRDIVLNQGQAYNPTTGYFVSPYQGLYYVSATTAGFDINQGANFYLYVDSTYIFGSSNYYENGHGVDYSTIHAVLHLNVGQRVWIMSDGSHYISGDYTFFSGFLLSHDF